MTTPALPAFYGKPIDTPTGHRWAGHRRLTPERRAALEARVAEHFGEPFNSLDHWHGQQLHTFDRETA